MTIFVVPIRLMAVIFALGLGWIICVLTVHGLSADDLKKPLKGWRRWIQREMGPPVAQFVFFVIGFMYIRTKGRRSTKKEAPILVMAPHSSWTDAMLHFVDGVSSPVSRMDNADLPFIGAMVKFLQPVFVSRDVADSRSSSVNEIKRRSTSDSDEHWQQVALFPEGTTTNRKSLISFKTGAFQPGVPVQPVVVRWPNYFDCVTWAFVGPNIWKLIWLQLCQPITFVEIQYLPVYTPSEEEKQNPVLFANNVRYVMANALKVPVSNYSFRDGIEFRRRFLAYKHSWAAKFALLENFTSRIGLGLVPLVDVVRGLLQRQKSGDVITKESLQEVLGMDQELLDKKEIKESFHNLLPLLQTCEVFGGDNLKKLEETTVKKFLEAVYPSSEESTNEMVTKLFKLDFITFEKLKDNIPFDVTKLE